MNSSALCLARPSKGGMGKNAESAVIFQLLRVVKNCLQASQGSLNSSILAWAFSALFSLIHSKNKPECLIT